MDKNSRRYFVWQMGKAIATGGDSWQKLLWDEAEERVAKFERLYGPKEEAQADA